MRPACEHSRLTIINDRSYIPIACAYVAAVARKMGFDEEDVASIERAVEEAATNVVEHAFEAYEQAAFDVSCERVPLGLRIVIKDQGAPFDPSRCIESESDGASDPVGGMCPGIALMKQTMDEVEFHNLGQEGKETVLIKYLKHRDITDYYEACDLGLYALPSTDVPVVALPVEITVRPMEPSEAIEVSRCVYRAYGYSYGWEQMYFPERIVELNRSGHLFSIVAVTPDNEVVGHMALIRRELSSPIVELGVAAVKPEFRSQGIFNRLNGFALSKCRSEGFLGVCGQAVTNHTYSQQAGHRVGMRDCAVVVAYVPTTASFKWITEILPQRETLVVHFMYLEQPSAVERYVPAHHAEMVRRLYANLGVTAELTLREISAGLGPREARWAPAAGDSLEDTGRRAESPVASAGGDTDICAGSGESAPLAETVAGDSVIKTSIAGPKGSSKIEVERCGPAIVTELKGIVRELCIKKFDVIYLYLDLTDVASMSVTRDFEEIGFFFAGILPGATLRGTDALILQYLNNLRIDYSRLKMHSSVGGQLLDYVRNHDPAQRAL